MTTVSPFVSRDPHKMWSSLEQEDAMEIGLWGQRLSKNEPRLSGTLHELVPSPSEEQLLLKAVVAGDLGEVKRLALAHPLWLMEPDTIGLYPIHAALIHGREEIVDFLIDSLGERVNWCVDSFSRRPLHIAAIVGPLRVIKRLVEECNSPLVQTFPGWLSSAPHVAARVGAVEFLRYFMEEMPETSTRKRATVLDHDFWHETPIFAACRHDQLETFKYCLERNPEAYKEKDEFGYPLYWYAVAQGATKIVTYMMEHRLNIYPPPHVQSLTRYAIQAGALELMQHLDKTGYVDSTAKEDEQDTYLAEAAQAGHLDMVRWLVEYCGRDVCAKNDSALLAALTSDKLEIVQWLYEKRKALPENTAPPLRRDLLLFALRCGYLTIAAWILDEGICDVNEADEEGITPLVAAVELVEDTTSDNLSSVHFLLERGANVLDCPPSSLFVKASQLGDLPLFQFLVERVLEVDPTYDMKTLDGAWTPFGAALAEGHTNILRYLVDQHHITITQDDFGFDNQENVLVWEILSEAGKISSWKLVEELLGVVYDQSHFESQLLDLDGDIRNPVSLMIQNSRLELLEFLLTERITFDPNDERCEHWSITATNETASIKTYDFFYLRGDSFKCNYPMEDEEGDISDNCSIMHTMCSLGALPQVKHLYRMGVSIHVKDTFGFTPVMVAAQAGRIETIKWLWRKGASLCTDPSLLDLAIDGGHNELATLLQRYDRGLY